MSALTLPWNYLFRSMIRKATDNDYNAVWEIFHAVIQSEDTYIYSANTPKEKLTELTNKIKNATTFEDLKNSL